MLLLCVCVHSGVDSVGVAVAVGVMVGDAAIFARALGGAVYSEGWQGCGW